MGKRDAFLGMPHGTATNRLRRNIMFSLLEKLKENTCFKCGLTIGTADTMSIEHKEPWENRDGGVDLFWSLDNIAFSHRSCNVPHVYRSGNSHVAENKPVGKQWCTTHQSYLDEGLFWKNSSRSSGFELQCKDCKREYDKSKRQNHTVSMS